MTILLLGFAVAFLPLLICIAVMAYDYRRRKRAAHGWRYTIADHFRLTRRTYADG